MRLSPAKATTWVEPPELKASPATGTILNIQRYSTEDGPGIRTTVFFKGCPLHCQWCHNPESIAPKPQVQWLETRCIGCWSCLEACPQQALTRSTQRLQRDLKRCTACGACVEACPSGAMELLGKKITPETLTRELMKDRTYFAKSEGGVTFSGGEPTLQVFFADELARSLKENLIPLALDTCGLCARQTFETLLPSFDLVLYDLKLIDSNAHEYWTGVPNALILENLRWLVQQFQTRWPEKRLWIRTPLIPGATASEANIKGIGAFLETLHSPSLERWELCAFNNLCRDKYRRLQLKWAFETTPLMSAAELEQAGDWARESGIAPDLVSVTGAARVEHA